MEVRATRAGVGAIVISAVFLALAVGGGRATAGSAALGAAAIPAPPSVQDKAPGGGVDPFAYHAVNDVIDAYIGELSGGTCWSDLWTYNYAPGWYASPTWSHEYSLWYDGMIHRSRFNGCNDVTDFVVEDTFGTATNDLDNYARVRSGDFTVGMTVTIDPRPRSPGNASFVQIAYTITNTGNSSESDVRFFALVDYDIPDTSEGNFTDDTSDYDPANNTLWVRDGRFFDAGLASNDRQFSWHGMEWYDFELWWDDSDGVLNGLERFGPSDPAVGAQWNISSLAPGASWTVNVLYLFSGEFVVADAGGPYDTYEGTTIWFDASASWGLGSVWYRWSFDGGATWDLWTSSPTLLKTWFDDFSGTVCLQVTNGVWTDADCTSVTVRNVDPTVTAWAGPEQDEGLPTQFAGAFFDPGSLDTHVTTWTFGDGSAPVPATFSPGVGSQDHAVDPISHTYGCCGPYAAFLTVTDDDGGPGAALVTVTIVGADPSVTLFPPVPADPYEGVPVTFDGQFDDPGWLDAHTATWDFGDGSSVTGTFSPGAGSTHHDMDAVEHAYDLAGTYTVSLSVQDDCGGNGQASAQVTVATPPPDYVPQDAQPNDRAVGLSLPVALSLEVRNDGPGPAPGPATLAFYNEASPAAPFATLAVPPLGPGERSARLGATWVSPAAPGIYRVFADVDYANDLAEANESNNRYAWTIRVVPGPVTTLHLGAPNCTAAVPFVTSSTPLTLSVEDRGGTGIRSTRVRIDSGAWGAYEAPFTLLGEGEHALAWQSEDLAGNVEAAGSAVLRVDDTPPTTSLEPATGVFTPTTTFLLSAADEGSGVDHTEVRIDGGAWIRYGGGFTLPSGDHAIGYRSVDRLGNREPERTRSVLVEGNLKPFVAAAFAAVLAAVGAWSARRAPWPTGAHRRLRAFAIAALPFVVGEAATGIASVLTRLLAIPPLLDAGTAVDLAILVGGILVAAYRVRRGRKPRGGPEN